MILRKKFPFFAMVFALAFLTVICYLPNAHANTSVSMIPASPSGSYRWLDVASQAYGTNYQQTYAYSQATVNVAFDTSGSTLRGTLTATNLKPNFAYQLKLEGTPGTADNEKIGYAGRWWQEEWNGAAWVNGQNLNNKGDGSSPNPNDDTYLDRRDIQDSTSPTGHKYRFTGYLLFDYLITDSNGAATLQFETGSSYHVLFKTTQQSNTASDGPTKTATFGPTSPPAYNTVYSSTTVSIFGEWERLPPGQVNLQPEIYNCQMILTEESFHETAALAGSWAGAMTANINFSITPTFPVPEYPLAGLAVLLSCFGAFVVFKKRDTIAARIKLFL
jgi:hypothetical protein